MLQAARPKAMAQCNKRSEVDEYQKNYFFVREIKHIISMQLINIYL